MSRRLTPSDLAAATPRTHREHVQSLADFARNAGVNRSSVTRLVAGKLRRALLPSGRVDTAHPVVVEWARARGVDPVALLSPGARPRPVVVIDDPSPAPPGHLTAHEFAARSGEKLSAVIVAIDGVLGPALLGSGRIDLAHPAALAYLAARPYELDAHGDPIGADGHLVGAVYARGEIDGTHPFARAYLARRLGRVLSDEDIASALESGKATS